MHFCSGALQTIRRLIFALETHALHTYDVKLRAKVRRE